MFLKCDVTGSTDRVQPLPVYMQTDKIKNVCFNVAKKMEKERLEGINRKATVKAEIEEKTPAEEISKEATEEKPAKKKSAKKKK